MQMQSLKIPSDPLTCEQPDVYTYISYGAVSIISSSFYQLRGSYRFLIYALKQWLPLFGCHKLVKTGSSQNSQSPLATAGATLRQHPHPNHRVLTKPESPSCQAQVPDILIRNLLSNWQTSRWQKLPAMTSLVYHFSLKHSFIKSPSISCNFASFLNQRL